MSRAQAQHLPYRPCVGMLVLNHQGLAWIGRRLPKGHDNGAEYVWQMPQGGVDPGEDLEAAARRELAEETGMVSVDVLAQAPDWFSYDLPGELLGRALRGRYRGQTQMWFAMRFTGDEREINLAPPGHTPEFDAWRWERLDALPDLIVPFKRPVYEQVVGAFRHLAAED